MANFDPGPGLGFLLGDTEMTDKKKTAQLTITVPRFLGDAIKELARIKGVSKSEIFRRAVEKHFEQIGHTPAT